MMYLLRVMICREIIFGQNAAAVIRLTAIREKEFRPMQLETFTSVGMSVDLEILDRCKSRVDLTVIMQTFLSQSMIQQETCFGFITAAVSTTMKHVELQLMRKAIVMLQVRLNPRSQRLTQLR